MKFEKATLEDATQVAALINAAFQVEWDPSIKNRFFINRTSPPAVEVDLKRANVIYLKGLQDGKMIACAYGEKKDDASFFVGLVSVQPGIHGKGLGSQIMTAMEDLGRELGCKIIKILTVNERPDLIRWYEKRGFYLNGFRDKFLDDGRYGFKGENLDVVGLQKEL